MFPVRGDAMAPFHTSLRDWLRGTGELGAGPDYMADEDDGVARLAAALWPRFTAWLADPSGAALDRFTRTELPALAARQPESALREALDAAGPWDRLAVALPELAQSATRSYAWTEARDWLNLIVRAAGPRGADGLGLRLWAWGELGDLETTLGRTDAAAAAFEETLTAATVLVASDPDNLDRRRDLSVSHEKIGDVKVSQGDLTSALNAYTAAMDIRKCLAEADKDNAGWRRDLSVSHNKIGDVKVAQGDLPGALNAYTAAMDIAKTLAEADKDNATWRRDIAVSHAKLGAVYRRANDVTRARQHLTDGRAIAADLAARFPGWAQWTNDLAWFDAQLQSLA